MLLLGLQFCGDVSGVRSAASDTPAAAGLTLAEALTSMHLEGASQGSSEDAADEVEI